MKNKILLFWLIFISLNVNAQDSGPAVRIFIAGFGTTYYGSYLSDSGVLSNDEYKINFDKLETSIGMVPNRKCDCKCYSKIPYDFLVGFESIILKNKQIEFTIEVEFKKEMKRKQKIHFSFVNSPNYHNGDGTNIYLEINNHTNDLKYTFDKDDVS